MKKVLIVGGQLSYYPPFEKWGAPTTDLSLLDTNPDEISLVVFTGGEDVTPALYGEEANYKTGNNTKRDEYEIVAFNKAKALNKPLVGICRGSQFLCVMAGGKLVQHLNGHGRYHNLKTDDGRSIWVSSTHHQMQLPPKGAIDLAWSEQRLSNIYEGAPGTVYHPEKEHDCVFYPNINALGMQYHPEYMDEDSDGFRYSIELTERCFKNVLQPANEV